MSTTPSRRRDRPELSFRRSDLTQAMSVTILIAALAGCSSPAAPQQVDAGASNPEGNPITDLRVAGIDGSTVTLAFTQVADASGSPADYQIRYQEGRLTDWDTALPVDDGTCEGTLTGTEVGDPYVCTVANLSLGVTYELQAVAVRSDQSSMVDGESQRVVAATPPPSEGGKVITEHTFASPVEDGWAEPMGNFTHGTEAGDGYGQANYTTGLCVGCGPINTWRNFSEEHNEVTVRMRWKLSPNFKHSTGSNQKKILFLSASGTDPIILGANANGSFYFNTQRTAEGARIMYGGSWSPGVEREVVLYVKLNSVDANGNSRPDGVVSVWVDGNRVMHGTDWRFRGHDSPSFDSGNYWEPEHGMNSIKWNPTWPNGGDSPSESMWERIYHIKVVSGQG